MNILSAQIIAMEARNFSSEIRMQVSGRQEEPIDAKNVLQIQPRTQRETKTESATFYKKKRAAHFDMSPLSLKKVHPWTILPLKQRVRRNISGVESLLSGSHCSNTYVFKLYAQVRREGLHLWSFRTSLTASAGWSRIRFTNTSYFHHFYLLLLLEKTKEWLRRATLLPEGCFGYVHRCTRA